MWDKLLDNVLRGFVRVGELDLTMPDGTRRQYRGTEPGPEVAITLLGADLPRKLVLSPDMTLGEGYMDGRITLGGDDIHGVHDFLSRNVDRAHDSWWRKLTVVGRVARRRFDQWNPAHRARQNVAHHYDLSAKLYDMFLDADRQYSCAYFPRPDMTLEEAQAAKKAHIGRKLCLEPGCAFSISAAAGAAWR